MFTERFILLSLRFHDQALNILLFLFLGKYITFNLIPAFFNYSKMTKPTTR